MTAATVFRHLIVGVDRLDYSKGLEERFLGFERFLADNPDLRREVLMLQIAPVSREAVEAYQEIRGRLDALSGRINGEFADIDWIAVPLCEPQLPPRRAGRHLSAPPASGLVTPLRDGMNLVAKEYRRRPGPGGSRRADPVAVRRRGAADDARPCWSIPTAPRRSPTR